MILYEELNNLKQLVLKFTELLCCFADETLLIAPNEATLQSMLDYLVTWCKLKVNSTCCTIEENNQGRTKWIAVIILGLHCVLSACYRDKT